MNNYEQDAMALDKELAELLGWTEIAETKYEYPHDMSGWSPNKLPGFVRRRTQDDAEAFRLMVEYKLEVNVENGFTFISSDETYGVCATHENFDSSFAATRFAIVQAVVNKLKGNV